jgi:hypothetical protein
VELRKRIGQSAADLANATHTVKMQAVTIGQQKNKLEEVLGELDDANNALLEISCDDDGGCCGCDKESEHVNDTNANEDFLKELALVLANDETLDVEQIPQLLTDIVTAIKVNTGR